MARIAFITHTFFFPSPTAGLELQVWVWLALRVYFITITAPSWWYFLLAGSMAAPHPYCWQTVNNCNRQDKNTMALSAFRCSANGSFSSFWKYNDNFKPRKMFWIFAFNWYLGAITRRAGGQIRVVAWGLAILLASVLALAYFLRIKQISLDIHCESEIHIFEIKL